MAKMSPDEFLRQVADIAKMSPDRPERVVSALRFNRKDDDAFQEWAQHYLGQQYTSWTKHAMLRSRPREVREHGRCAVAHWPASTD
jgi:hypothetical protein